MKNDRIKLGIAAVVIAFVGIGVGASAAQPETIVKTETVTLPAPSPQVVTVPGPTITIEITPQSCIDALDFAGDAFGIAADAFEAIGEDNYEALAGTTDALDKVIDPYIAARDECYATVAANPSS